MSQVTNSVSSTFLKGMTDDEIRTKCAEVSEQFMAKAFPGANVNAGNLDDALAQAGAAFEVAKRPLLVVHSSEGLKDEDAPISEVTTHVGTTRTDTNQALGVVSPTYGVAQTTQAMQSLDILAKRGDVQIKKVGLIGNGARVRVTALLGLTSFPSMSGEPNTLGHFAVFEATHDGNAHTTVSVYTMRLECFNGMTSRSVIPSHKLRHTSKASDRAEQLTQEVLSTLIGDVEAERELFLSMASTPVSLDGFRLFLDEFLGEPEPEKEEDTRGDKAKRTRLEKDRKELEEYFIGGNQGAGPTVWGEYCSVTRWLEAKREGIEDAAKAAKKFNSNLEGDGQRKLQRAVKLLTK